MLTVERRPPTGDRGWVFALLPGFPLLLLVLRVWFLAGQDPQIMLVVLQNANPLGLFASLFFTVMWVVPAAVLTLRVLFLMLLGSGVPGRSLLARAGARTPAWVAPPAVLLAALTWQLRFLPTLVMLTLLITALEVRLRAPAGAFRVPLTAIAVPVAVGVLELSWLAGAIRDAVAAGEPTTTALLLAPPVLTPLLAGPLPARAARRLLPAVGAVLLMLMPLVLGRQYLGTPVLPRVALTVAQGGALTVHRGSLIAVDNAFASLLEDNDQVAFYPVTTLRAELICSSGAAEPTSTVWVHGWQVELNLLSWAGPQPGGGLPWRLRPDRPDNC